MSSSTTHEYSIILWLAMAAVAVLTGHVGLGWLQMARRQASLTLGWRAQLLAAGTLATGMTATAVLGLTNEILKFPVGYGSVAAPVLWLGAVLLALPLVALMSIFRRWWAVLIATLLLTGMVIGAQMGWIWGAGFRPGVQWNLKLLAVSATLMMAGFGCALWMANSQSTSSRSSSSSEPQTFLRLGAAMLLGLTLVVGQQVVMGAADLGVQRGSVYRNQVPGTLLALAFGALMPLTLSVMALDLKMRKQHRSRSGSGFNPQKRRKRRHRVRTL
jgi:hypothetical protein